MGDLTFYVICVNTIHSDEYVKRTLYWFAFVACQTIGLGVLPFVNIHRTTVCSFSLLITGCAVVMWFSRLRAVTGGCVVVVLNIAVYGVYRSRRFITADNGATKTSIHQSERIL